jgi:hypothetical protein
MDADEDRYRIELGGKIGIGHKECQDEIQAHTVVVRVREAYVKSSRA